MGSRACETIRKIARDATRAVGSSGGEGLAATPVVLYLGVTTAFVATMDVCAKQIAVLFFVVCVCQSLMLKRIKVSAVRHSVF